ncbi:hypothetical protein [Arthrobacter sp. C9C5]|uniref:hypothetical protein n=1 Tax=Arthrobacter sp. C9C5 TaxID=2735267 RepID=UPI0015852DF4|nr:hypothetical protein [Arthrobacter sp. C9C5]NUU33070.1 hypothetical protein [Arthrobacter sp. C9C5]
MPIQPVALPTRTGNEKLSAPEARRPARVHLAEIREQAAGIIAEVLSGTDPRQARARDALRRQCAAHPEDPETALAEHLQAIRTLALVPGAFRDPAPVHGPAGSSVESKEIVGAIGLLSGEEAPVRDDSSLPGGGDFAGAPSAMTTAVIGGTPAGDRAAAAHLPAVEVMDAADGAVYPGPAWPASEPGH